MIKLLWNTHNQKKANSENKKIREKEEQDYVWGQYHQKSSEKWIYELLKEIKFSKIEDVTLMKTTEHAPQQPDLVETTEAIKSIEVIDAITIN